MQVIGHRGCGAQYPENTVYAVRQAARRLDAVEVDVRRCATGELVAFHDETLDRVTDAEGALADAAWEQLRELTVEGSSHRVARFAEVIAAVPAGTTAQVELKETGIAADALAACDTAAATADVRVTSFDPDALAEVRRVDPTVTTGYLVDRDERVRDAIRTALDLDCDALHPPCERCAETDADVVERARAAGLDVIAWGGGVSAPAVSAAATAGADGVTADRWNFDLDGIGPRFDAEDASSA